MSDIGSELKSLQPHEKPNVIDLVRQAGFDVSDWKNWKGGPENAGANPRYCYEWCFEQEGMSVFNIWYENLICEGTLVMQRLNLRKALADQVGPQKSRARKFDAAIQRSFDRGSNPRIVILDRKKHGKGGASARMLDRAPWTVTRYDHSTGEFVLVRGIVPTEPLTEDDELLAFPEGEKRRFFVAHRHREAKLRQQKIEDHKRRNGGCLPCEVPGCGFDFFKTYGVKGCDYAHVHHLVPLSKAGDEGVVNRIDDLAVVCANCHAMIHRGGECRDMKDILPGA